MLIWHKASALVNQQQVRTGLTRIEFEQGVLLERQLPELLFNLMPEFSRNLGVIVGALEEDGLCNLVQDLLVVPEQAGVVQH